MSAAVSRPILQLLNYQEAYSAETLRPSAIVHLRGQLDPAARLGHSTSSSSLLSRRLSRLYSLVAGSMLATPSPCSQDHTSQQKSQASKVNLINQARHKTDSHNSELNSHLLQLGSGLGLLLQEALVQLGLLLEELDALVAATVAGKSAKERMKGQALT